jgi:hypothetical protein
VYEWGFVLGKCTAAGDHYEKEIIKVIPSWLRGKFGLANVLRALTPVFPIHFKKLACFKHIFASQASN